MLVLLSLAALAGCRGTTAAGTTYVIHPTRVLESHVPGALPVVHQVAREVVEFQHMYPVERDIVEI